MPTGCYYFDLHNNIRPWVGLGLSFVGVTTFDNNDPNIQINEPSPEEEDDPEEEDLFDIADDDDAPFIPSLIGFLVARSVDDFVDGAGISFMAGVDLRYITLALSYNINPPSRAVIRSFDENSNLVTRNVELLNNYFGITVGFLLGR